MQFKLLSTGIKKSVNLNYFDNRAESELYNS